MNRTQRSRGRALEHRLLPDASYSTAAHCGSADVGYSDDLWTRARLYAQTAGMGRVPV